MRQQSLASFFKKKDGDKKKEEKKPEMNDKENPESGNKKRNLTIDSDEEEFTSINSKKLKQDQTLNEEKSEKAKENQEEEKQNQKEIIEKEVEEKEQIKEQKTPPKKNLEVPKKQNSEAKKSTKKQEQEEERKPTEGLKYPFDAKYHIINDAHFYKGQNIPFRFVAETLEYLQEVKGKDSKAKKIDILSKMFKSIILLNPEQLVKTYYYCILRIAPDYELNELGIGDSLIKSTLQVATGKSAKQIRTDLTKYGDLGLVAFHSKSTQKNISTFFTKKVVKLPLTMVNLYSKLYEIAHTKGINSNQAKESIIIKLLQDSAAVENKFIVRYIEKNLRIGCAEKTMQEGLTKALFEVAYFGEKQNFNYSESQTTKLENYSMWIKRTLCEYPNYEEVIETLLKIGKDIDELPKKCKVTPGTPCKPMLAKPTKSIQVILKRFENQKFTCEYKYDGLRGQIHYKDKEVTIFSRNLENMTQTYPDIVKLVKDQIGEGLDSFILDSEIVAFDTNTNKIRSFQELSNRARKNVSLEDINVKVCIFMFDLIYINGKSLLQQSLSVRRQHIQENFQVIDGKFQMATHLDSDNVEEIQQLLQQSIKDGCEGLMVKTLVEDGSSYEPAKRSFKWLKLKKDYLDSGLGDSFDLVPIGAMEGGGKRKGLYGAYLLASYNDDKECYETICKAGTGFSDQQLEAFHKYFQDKIISNPPSEYRVNDFKADVWFQPSIVWEIKGADLQISPVYTCAQGNADENRGIGLRFPRLVRVRDDKKPEEATTAEQVYEIYQQQSTVDGNLEDDDDYY